MKKQNIVDQIFAEMDRIYQSPEHQAIFPQSLEKVAFTKVSDEDKVGEIEKEVEENLNKEAQEKFVCAACKDFYKKNAGDAHQCACDCKSSGDCAKGCACHNPVEPALDFAKFKLSSAVNELLKLSENLDEIGFEKQAAATLVLINSLVSEAKAKKDKKDKKKSTPKERMEKLKSSKKDDKKSSEKSKEKSKSDKKSDKKSSDKK